MLCCADERCIMQDALVSVNWASEHIRTISPNTKTALDRHALSCSNQFCAKKQAVYRRQQDGGVQEGECSSLKFQNDDVMYCSPVKCPKFAFRLSYCQSCYLLSNLWTSFYSCISLLIYTHTDIHPELSMSISS